MVLVDTSVWVSHLRSGEATLEELLLNLDVCCHPFIVGELACGRIGNREEVLSLLRELPPLPVVDLEEFLHFLGAHQLAGTGLGFVDVHLLASASLADVPLWTADKKLAATAHDLDLSFA
ncbi:MAG: PIN domain-containing protein [Planctomycetota bacterium]